MILLISIPIAISVLIGIIFAVDSAPLKRYVNSSLGFISVEKRKKKRFVVFSRGEVLPGRNNKVYIPIYDFWNIIDNAKKFRDSNKIIIITLPCYYYSSGQNLRHSSWRCEIGKGYVRVGCQNLTHHYLNIAEFVKMVSS